MTVLLPSLSRFVLFLRDMGLILESVVVEAPFRCLSGTRSQSETVFFLTTPLMQPRRKMGLTATRRVGFHEKVASTCRAPQSTQPVANTLQRTQIRQPGQSKTFQNNDTFHLDSDNNKTESAMLTSLKPFALVLGFVAAVHSQQQQQEFMIPPPTEPARVSCDAAFSAPCSRHNSQYLAVKTANEIAVMLGSTGSSSIIYQTISIDRAHNMDIGFYPFVIDRNTGRCVAHGTNNQLVGLTLQEIFEAKGITFSDTDALHQRFKAAADNGGDWVGYLWNDDSALSAITTASKVSYVTNLTDQYYLGVGYSTMPLPEDLPCTDKLDAFCSRTNVRSLVGKAQAKLSAADSLEAFEAVFHEISFDAVQFTVPDGFYLFVYNYSGPLVAHARLQTRFGESLEQIVPNLGLGTAQEGRNLHELFVAASLGQNDGWTQYPWRNSIQESIYTKIAFVVPIQFGNGTQYYVGAGFNYDRGDSPLGPKDTECSAAYNTPCAFQSTLQLSSHALSHVLSSPLDTNTMLQALHGPDFLSGTDDSFYVFAYSANGTCVAHGRNNGYVGMTLWEVLDSANIPIDGRKLHEQFLAAASEGGGWVLYDWINPGFDKSPAEKISYIFPFNLDGELYYAGVGLNHDRYPIEESGPGLRLNGLPVSCSSSYNLPCSDVNSRALLGEALVELTLAASPRQARITSSASSGSGDLYDVLRDIRRGQPGRYSTGDFGVAVFATDPADGACESYDGSGYCVAFGGHPEYVDRTWQEILDEQQITSVQGFDLHNRLIDASNLGGSSIEVPWSGSSGLATTKKMWVARFRRTVSSPAFYVLSDYDLTPQPATCDACPSDMECTEAEQEYCRDKPDPPFHEEPWGIALIVLIAVGIPLMGLAWWWQRRRARIRNEQVLAAKERELRSMAEQMEEQMHRMVKVIHDMNINSHDEYSAWQARPNNALDCRWYWEEDSAHLAAHKVQMVKAGTNFVAYAREVSDRVETAYRRFQEGRGYAEVELDLTDKITSTMDGGKANNQQNGCAYVINFQHMTQRNVKTGHERNVLRDETAPRSNSIDLSSEDLPELPTDKDFQQQPLLPVYKGQVIQVTKEHPSDSAWLYGNVLFDPLVSQAMKDQQQQGSSANVSDAVTAALASALHDRPTTGWFPACLTEAADVNVMKDLIQSLGNNGVDALKPPPNWDESDQVRVQLTSDKPEYREVAGFFMNGLRNEAAHIEVVQIHRIQNLPLFQSYTVKKLTMEDQNGGNANERRLFHGTSADVAHKIEVQGFNRSFAGDANAVRYGRGCYLARDAAYSSHRAYSAPDRNGVQRMFLCKVAVGEYCLGRDGQRTPDSKPSNPLELYDTTVDTMSNPAVFVVYHDAQAYPEYLISFRRID